MARNVEIKVCLANPEETSRLAHALSDGPPTLIQQTDTFFACPRGRLKLRDFQDGTGELIFYQRPDQAGPKVSQYAIFPTTQPNALLAILSSAYPVLGTVEKTRNLLMSGRTRIHLDEVVKLGSFLELEVVLAPGDTIDAGEQEAHALLKSLHVPTQDLIEISYLDLLLNGQG